MVHAVALVVSRRVASTLDRRKAATAGRAVAFDGAVAAGDVPPWLLKEVQEFIELNRAVLLDYWECGIDTEQLRERLRPIPAR